MVWSYLARQKPNPLQIPGPQEISSLPPVSVSDGVIHVEGEKKQDIPIKDKFPGTNSITELFYNEVWLF